MTNLEVGTWVLVQTEPGTQHRAQITNVVLGALADVWEYDVRMPDGRTFAVQPRYVRPETTAKPETAEPAAPVVTEPTAEPDTAATFDEWAIVELMGHRRLAGRIREVQIAGAGFLRLDIPAAGQDPGRTQYIAPGSVYALHPVTEDTARQAAAGWRPPPVQRWELAPVPAAREVWDDPDAEDGL